MIPTIGVMMGAYIFTRMIELVTTKETHGAVIIFAIITMIVVFLGVIGLMTTSGTH